MSSTNTQRLVRALENDLPPPEQAQLEIDLLHDEHLRHEYAQLKQLAADLARPDAAAQFDLVAGLSAQLDRVPTLRRPGPRSIAVAAGVAATLVAVLALSLLRAPASEFQPRGAADEAGRWVGLEAFRIRGVRVAGRLEHSLRQGDGLAFAYRNSGEHPFSHLMIFATDAQHQVFWFYPAWTQPADDPTAIAIVASSASVELREVIRHDLAPGPLTIHGLFTNEALHVKQVERALAAPGGALDLPGVVEQRFTVMVESAP